MNKLYALFLNPFSPDSLFDPERTKIVKRKSPKDTLVRRFGTLKTKSRIISKY
jgi:hypothetical protein